MSVCPCVRIEQLGSLLTDFHEIWYSSIFRKSVEFHENVTRITGTLQDDVCTVLVISFSFFLRMRNISDKSCRENQNTHYVLNNVCVENANDCIFFCLFRMRENWIIKTIHMRTVNHQKTQRPHDPYLLLLLPWRFDSVPSHGLSLRGFAIILIGPVTLGMTRPDEWSARRRDLFLTTHNTHKRKKNPSPPEILERALRLTFWQRSFTFKF
jgi:hypothetical protein